MSKYKHYQIICQDFEGKEYEVIITVEGDEATDVTEWAEAITKKIYNLSAIEIIRVHQQMCSEAQVEPPSVPEFNTERQQLLAQIDEAVKEETTSALRETVRRAIRPEYIEAAKKELERREGDDSMDVA